MGSRCHSAYGAAGLMVWEGMTLDPTDGTVGAGPFDGEYAIFNVRFRTARIDCRPVSQAIEGVLAGVPQPRDLAGVNRIDGYFAGG